eukprot:CAMPEP_0171750878 /NCGR_PEP_ID=MMETSP0991-20121206/41673_2 /TAXON_ID=483369 /ORGANISM="non described non described, Strain CCMP2098" /LENGTH=41 /DNA_ID= /DNA_START= /DNA_END= /DNA_ORIENTATION=
MARSAGDEKAGVGGGGGGGCKLWWAVGPASGCSLPHFFSQP